jgi:hypothetical protein
MLADIARYSGDKRMASVAAFAIATAAKVMTASFVRTKSQMGATMLSMTWTPTWRCWITVSVPGGCRLHSMQAAGGGQRGNDGSDCGLCHVQLRGWVRKLDHHTLSCCGDLSGHNVVCNSPNILDRDGFVPQAARSEAGLPRTQR